MPETRPESFARDAVVALCSESGLDGGVLRQPLARWQAEALAEVLSRSAGRRYWIEELSSLPAEGHVRRRRRRPRR